MTPTATPIGRAPSGEPRTVREQGQATIELALVLPFLLVAGLTLVQGALVVSDQLAVVHAAREAVRAASVDPDPKAPGVAAEAVLPGAVVSTGKRPPIGSPIVVEVGYTSRTVLPVIGPLLPDPRLSARAVMRVEQ